MIKTAVPLSAAATITEEVEALDDISQLVICCHCNDTCAPTAYLPKTAQLEGTPCHSPSYIRVCAVVWECSEGKTDRHTVGRGQYTFHLSYTLCKMQQQQLLLPLLGYLGAKLCCPCLCWRQLPHSHQAEDSRVLLDGVICNVSRRSMSTYTSTHFLFNQSTLLQQLTDCAESCKRETLWTLRAGFYRLDTVPVPNQQCQCTEETQSTHAKEKKITHRYSTILDS